MDNKIDEIIYNTFSDYVLTGNLYGRKDDIVTYGYGKKDVYNFPKKYTYTDLTGEMKEYISLDNNADILNPEMSVRACELHAKMMSAMWDCDDPHSREELRRAFATILIAIRIWLPNNSKFVVFEYNKHRGWGCINLITGAYLHGECTLFDGFEEDDLFENIFNSVYGYKTDIPYAVGYFEDNPDINYGEVEHRGESCNGSSGFHHNPKTTSMTKEGADRIRKMGLVPCILETGSYHENFFHLVGIYPQCWEQWKKHYRGSDSLITREEE